MFFFYLREIVNIGLGCREFKLKEDFRNVYWVWV